MTQKLSILLLLCSALSLQAMEEQVAVPAAASQPAAQDEEQLFELLKTQFRNRNIKGQPFFLDLLYADLETGTPNLRTSFKEVYVRLINEIGKEAFYQQIITNIDEAQSLGNESRTAGNSDIYRQADSIRAFCKKCIQMLITAFPEEMETQKYQDVYQHFIAMEGVLAKAYASIKILPSSQTGKYQDARIDWTRFTWDTTKLF